VFDIEGPSPLATESLENIPGQQFAYYVLRVLGCESRRELKRGVQYITANRHLVTIAARIVEG
jgi:hypothetical protein